jgi:hypothetical protein
MNILTWHLFSAYSYRCWNFYKPSDLLTLLTCNVMRIIKMKPLVISNCKCKFPICFKGIKIYQLKRASTWILGWHVLYLKITCATGKGNWTRKEKKCINFGQLPSSSKTEIRVHWISSSTSKYYISDSTQPGNYKKPYVSVTYQVWSEESYSL